VAGLLELLLAIVIVVLIILYYRSKIKSIHALYQQQLRSIQENFSQQLQAVKAQSEAQAVQRAQEIARQLLEQWRAAELEQVKKTMEEAIRKEYDAKFNEWKQRAEEEIREDAVKRSLSTILGRVGEQVAPLLVFLELGVEPKDLRFIGTPVDYVAFKGLSRDNVEEIIFLEVKTGEKARLEPRQREIKRVIEEKKVRFVVFNVSEVVEKIKAKGLKELPLQQEPGRDISRALGEQTKELPESKPPAKQ
jgi:predicted Holliday junction resolvase-like endonuclease